jgi:hypothetical protein
MVYFPVSPEAAASTASNRPKLSGPLRTYIRGLSLYVLATFLADLAVVSVLLSLAYCFIFSLSLFSMPEGIASTLYYARSAVLILGTLYGLAALVAAGVRHYRYFSYKFPYEPNADRVSAASATEDKPSD